jgi:hypothetical protein
MQDGAVTTHSISNSSQSTVLYQGLWGGQGSCGLKGLAFISMSASVIPMQYRAPPPKTRYDGPMSLPSSDRCLSGQNCALGNSEFSRHRSSRRRVALLMPSHSSSPWSTKCETVNFYLRLLRRQKTSKFRRHGCGTLFLTGNSNVKEAEIIYFHCSQPLLPTLKRVRVWGSRRGQAIQQISRWRSMQNQ